MRDKYFGDVKLDRNTSWMRIILAQPHIKGRLALSQMAPTHLAPIHLASIVKWRQPIWRQIYFDTASIGALSFWRQPTLAQPHFGTVGYYRSFALATRKG